ncbi:hypothetical protein Fmac_006234 [Flemingia macrophylla]|uniref:Uncharacterized protein n=1 Tax=Flemingia macrophylla TaxID=520843 RepID=A0ABD1NA00_9FABA
MPPSQTYNPEKEKQVLQKKAERERTVKIQALNGITRGKSATWEDPHSLFNFAVDSGNNNYLPTTARSDLPPYGIDYPSHRPTGRFSKGFNLPDLISQRIGSEPILPYLSAELNGERLLVGGQLRICWDRNPQ